MKMLFHHMPKAGGSSVIRSFREAGAKHVRASFWQKVDSGREWVSRRPGMNLYSSHHALADIEPEGDEFYFTFIRNPVDMLFSGYSYYKSRPHPRFQPVAELERIRHMVRFQTCRKYIDAVLDGEVEPFPRDVWNLNWDRFHFVGICEAMPESVRKLGRMVGRDIRPTHVNRSMGRRRRIYRRAELRKLFEKEMETWKKYKREMKACLTT